MIIRRIDRLKLVERRGVIVVLIILLSITIGTLGSCTPNSYPELNRHSLIFEPGNNETFLFSSHHQDSLGYANREIPNGYVFADGSSYTFTMEDDVVTVTVGRSPENVKYESGVLSKESEVIKMSNASFSRELDPNGFFIIDYAFSLE